MMTMGLCTSLIRLLVRWFGRGAALAVALRRCLDAHAAVVVVSGVAVAVTALVVAGDSVLVVDAAVLLAPVWCQCLVPDPCLDRRDLTVRLRGFALLVLRMHREYTFFCRGSCWRYVLLHARPGALFKLRSDPETVAST